MHVQHFSAVNMPSGAMGHSLQTAEHSGAVHTASAAPCHRVAARMITAQPETAGLSTPVHCVIFDHAHFRRARLRNERCSVSAGSGRWWYKRLVETSGHD
jgi:hypothetical protein